MHRTETQDFQIQMPKFSKIINIKPSIISMQDPSNVSCTYNVGPLHVDNQIYKTRPDCYSVYFIDSDRPPPQSSTRTGSTSFRFTKADFKTAQNRDLPFLFLLDPTFPMQETRGEPGSEP